MIAPLPRTRHLILRITGLSDMTLKKIPKVLCHDRHWKRTLVAKSYKDFQLDEKWTNNY
jgi:hypothetical protein